MSASRSASDRPTRRVRRALGRLATFVAWWGVAACGGDVAPPAAAPGPPEPPPVASALHVAMAVPGDPAPTDGRRGVVVAFDVAADRIATAGRDALAALRDSDGEVLALCGGHRARVLAVALTRDGGVVTGAADGALRRFSPRGVLVAETALGRSPIVGVASAGGVVAAASLDGVVRVFGTDGAALGEVGAPETPLVRVAVLADGGAVVAASRAPGTLVVVAPDGTEIATLRDLGESAERFVVDPSGDSVIVGSVSGEVWRVAIDGKVALLHRHEAAVQSVAVAAGGVVASGALDGTVHVVTPRGTLDLSHGAPVHRVVASREAVRVVTVGADRVARIWDAAGREVGHASSSEEPVTGAAVSPDGSVVAVWSGAGPLRLVDAGGSALVEVPGTEAGVLGARFAPDGAVLVVLGADRTIRTWPLGEDALRRRAGRARGAVSDEVVARVVPYAGPEWCARCHRPEYSRWLASSHAWTSSLAGPETLPREVLRGGLVHHDPGETSFGHDDDGWWAETAGESGEIERFRLTHVAGNLRMRMLLTTLDDGRMQVLPGMTEWPDGPWFDYTHLLYGDGADADALPVVHPGESGFWTGSVRSWDQRCAVCHTSGRLAREPGPDGRGPRSVWRSLGVDCETCHGPGRAHAEAWERGETGAPLLRLEGLPRDQAVAVCTQCHMEGDRVTPSYSIGEPLYEHLDPTAATDPRRADPYGRALELIYDGLPFATSRCAEQGGLTCSRCHEPHGGPVRSQLRDEPTTGALCTACHDDVARRGREHTGHDPRGSGGACVACHMPFLEIERGHGAVADHTLGVPMLDLPGDRVATDACTWCHQAGRKAPRDAPRIGPEALRNAYARWWPAARGPLPWMRALAAARVDDPSAAPELVRIARDPSQPRLVRASATRLLERFPGRHVPALLELSRDADSLVRRHALHALAASAGEEIDARLREALGDPSRAVRVNAARAILAGWTRAREQPELLAAAVPVLEEDVERISDDSYRWFVLGAARGLLGDDAGALEAYEHVVTLDPTARAVREHVARLRQRLR